MFRVKRKNPKIKEKSYVSITVSFSVSPARRTLKWKKQMFAMADETMLFIIIKKIVK